MHLVSLTLRNFRIYEEAVFAFCPKINMIWGENAIGKTTVLEAIYFLVTGRSFRTQHTAELIRAGASFFAIEARFIKHGIDQRLKVSFDGKDRKIFHNSTSLQSSTNLLGILQGVLITPDDSALVKGAPLTRRHYLDLQIAQGDPLYVHYVTRYNQAMRQRNVLLKTKTTSGIETWENEMAAAAAYITLQRRSTVEELNLLAKPLHHHLSGKDEAFTLEYKSTAPQNLNLNALKSYHLELYQRHRRREMELGITLNGPQKDDLFIFLKDLEVRHFASEGQQRSAVATLRLAEWTRLKDVSEEAPLMLIDDLGISLDDHRKGKLLNYLKDLSQVFLTFTQPAHIACSEDDLKILPIHDYRKL